MDPSGCADFDRLDEPPETGVHFLGHLLTTKSLLPQPPIAIDVVPLRQVLDHIPRIERRIASQLAESPVERPPSRPTGVITVVFTDIEQFDASVPHHLVVDRSAVGAAGDVIDMGPKGAADRFIHMANSRGGRDNITAVVVNVR